LLRGASPALDFPLFEAELERLTDAVCNGTFLQDHAPPEARTLKDFAFSGNGEPTSCPDFSAAVRHVGQVRARCGGASQVGLVLITNGSLINRASVRQGLQVLSDYDGEVWFKLDRGTDSALATANGTSISLDRQLLRLRLTSEICRTKIQSCWYTTDSEDPSSTEVDEYVACLERAIGIGAKLESVQLYTLARKPLLPEGAVLGPVSATWLSDLGARLAKLGLRVDL
jgi:wyosine [tRNA(Phe)-imidazoG37] synthetase (radical SAM superfamily)